VSANLIGNIEESAMKIGLRIDVDTFRGTRYGVPNLCRLFADHAVKATFFFSVGPDNMGRHLWRLVRPDFLKKMLRTRASSLYGWDILLRGTFWPGPIIGEKLGHTIRSAADNGHEVGLHAWDHHAWQARLDRMDAEAVQRSLTLGVDLLTRILGRPPITSAAPAWRCNDLVLRLKNKFGFRYNSDCRGQRIFLPLVDGQSIPQPQIPVTLPTYDEVIGRNGIDANNYNAYLLSLLKPGVLNVLTIHAEVEGMACFTLFSRFIEMVKSKGFLLVPLGSLLNENQHMEPAAVVAGEIPGREGWVACQAS
jgi:undecaprenyl phosphate-alpha-L-ara4FN deformylase